MNCPKLTSGGFVSDAQNNSSGLQQGGSCGKVTGVILGSVRVTLLVTIPKYCLLFWAALKVDNCHDDLALSWLSRK